MKCGIALIKGVFDIVSINLKNPTTVGLEAF